MEEELKSLLGVDVDLLTPGDLPPKFRAKVARGGATDMSENRLPDYLDHIQQAATDARSFVEGMARTTSGRQAHPAGRHHEPDRHRRGTKVMDGYVEFTQRMPTCRRSMRNMRNRMAHSYFDINLDGVGDGLRNGCRRWMQLPAVRQDADDEDRNDNCERGSPMT